MPETKTRDSAELVGELLKLRGTSNPIQLRSWRIYVVTTDKPDGNLSIPEEWQHEGENPYAIFVLVHNENPLGFALGPDTMMYFKDGWVPMADLRPFELLSRWVAMVREPGDF